MPTTLDTHWDKPGEKGLPWVYTHPTDGGIIWAGGSAIFSEWGAKLQELEKKKQELNQTIKTKQQQLSKLQQQLAEQKAKVDLLEREIEEKSLQGADMTPEEKAKLADLDRKIKNLQDQLNEARDKLNSTLAKWTPDYIEKQLAAYKQDLERAKAKLAELKREYSDEAIEAKAEVQKATILKDALIRYQIYRVNRALLKIEGNKIVPDRYVIYSVTGSSTRRSVLMTASSAASQANQEVEQRLNQYRWNLKSQGQSQIGFAQTDVQNAQDRYDQQYNRLLTQKNREISDAKYEVNRLQNNLDDLEAAKQRTLLEIRRAVALRQAEIDAAKKRLELEKRTLKNFQDTVKMLEAEIEAAKKEAIAVAAEYDANIQKAKEEERRKIAEQQRAAAEAARKKAEAAAAYEKKKWLEKQKQLEEKARQAEKEAEKAAKERERKAYETATLNAELAVAREKVKETQHEITQVVTPKAKPKPVPRIEPHTMTEEPHDAFKPKPAPKPVVAPKPTPVVTKPKPAPTKIIKLLPGVRLKINGTIKTLSEGVYMER